MSAPPDLETAAAALYAGSREDFIAARTKLVKAAKAAGHAALASNIAALAKPGMTAWAVNCVWWAAPELIRELFAAAADLRATLVGGGGPHATEPVRARHRKAVAAATLHASDAMPSAVTIATRRRIATTIEALGALGRWPAPGPGCLAEDLDPPGFESLGGLPEVDADAAPPPELGANDGARALAQATAAVRHAAARQGMCRDQHDALRAVHKAALDRAADAEQALARARAHHDACVAAAQATARDLAQRQEELDDAAVAHAAAVAVLEGVTDKR